RGRLRCFGIWAKNVREVSGYLVGNFGLDVRHSYLAHVLDRFGPAVAVAAHHADLAHRMAVEAFLEDDVSALSFRQQDSSLILGELAPLHRALLHSEV